MRSNLLVSGTEILKIVPSIMPYLKDPSKAATPFNLAYDTTDTIWEFAGRPGNEASAKRQAVLMAGGNKQFSPDTFVNGTSRF